MWHYNYSNNELYHYGVLGMKWGHRKKYESINLDNIPSEKKKSNHRLKLEAKYLIKGMLQDEAEKAASKRIKIEKVIAVTAGITVVAATAYVARNEYVKKQTLNILTTMGESDISSWQDIPHITRDHSFVNDVQNANPNFKKGRPFKMNCTYSTIAYELRRRGLDVEAMPIDTKGLSSETYKSWFKNPTVINPFEKTIKEIKSDIVNWGDGARGVAWVDFGKVGSKMGHAFSVEVIKGVAQFVDPQVGTYSDVSSYFSLSKTGGIMRVDNLELADDILKTVRKGV